MATGSFGTKVRTFKNFLIMMEVEHEVLDSNPENVLIRSGEIGYELCARPNHAIDIKVSKGTRATGYSTIMTVSVEMWNVDKAFPQIIRMFRRIE